MDLLRHADTAMYAAKAAGLAWETYSPSLDKGRAERLELLGDLRLALDGDQLQLYYQPKLDLDLGRVASVEALVRWDHPTRGLLAPDVFIPLAESTGLIDQLTAVVLAKALQQCRLWRDAGHDLSVAVNFSARNVNNMELPELISAALVAAGLPADRLIVEITESAIMGDPERTVPTLNRLAATGVTLSLDDFGTGHSGLAYLHQLPVGEVKIDRSFVMGLLSADGTRTSSAVVQSIIRLGRDLDLRIVAEGVENQEMLERLHELGCHVVQGYHIGRPAPRDRVLETISKAQHVTVNG
jgi:EAL domain-containing protein (putative c-di-GMP-specific phosphodiesterase class I)